MKKQLMPLITILLLSSCQIESMTDIQPNQEIAKNSPNALLNENGLPQFLTGTELGNSSSGEINSKISPIIDEYVLPGTTENGLATGFMVKEGVPVSVSASGEIGFYFAGLADPATPDGRLEDVGTIDGFPAVSLVARVGDGGLQFVGTGPTLLTGSGELVLYVNDSFFGDNLGAWTVEVSYDCYPGYGIGDKNHYHCK